VFVLSVAVVSLGLALVRGGNLLALGQVRIRFSGVLLAALLLKAAVYSTIGIQYLGSGWLSRITHLMLTVVLFVVILVNRDLPGFWIIGLGILSNLLVLLANGGSMPVSLAGAERLGLSTDPLPFHQHFGEANILQSEGARLWFLGDVIVSPSFLPAKVISIGDMLVAIGMFIFCQKVMVGPYPAETAPSSGISVPASYPDHK
jgi:hypothetical protein